MNTSLVIAHRFRGPSNSGNGGYVCGMVARQIGREVEVTLRHPPPLGESLRLDASSERLRLLYGDIVIADARPTSFDLIGPAPPSVREAEAASENYTGHRSHLYPQCFVCGPERQFGDGLRIFAGAWKNDGTVAAPWRPHESLGDERGMVREEFIWASMDCPGAFAVVESLGPMLLGRMTARIEDGVRVGERCVVVGWALGVEGRKRYAGTALFGEDGRRCGIARATWIDLPSGA